MRVPESETYCAAHITSNEGGLEYVQSKHQLSAEDFAEPVPFAVVRVAEELREDGHEVNPGAVRHRLREEDVWDDPCGGPEWWSGFVGTAGDGENIDLHAERVSNASRLRAVSGPAEEIKEVCANGQRPGEAIEDVEGLTTELLEAQASQESNVMDGEEIAEGVMVMITSDEPANLTLDTGWTRYDDRFGGLIQNRINIFAARTDHGKTVAADQVGLNVGRRFCKQGLEKSVVIFDLENDKSSKQMRFAANLSGVPIQAISRHAEGKEPLADPQIKKVHRAADTLQGLPVVVDTTPGADSTYIRSRVLTEQATREVGLVIVDYLTQMGEPGDGAMEKTMNAVRGLHDLAKSLKIPILAVSQINREPVRGSDPEPKLHHMSWSDSVARKPAQVTTLLHHLAHWDQTSRSTEARPDPEKFSVFVRKNKGPKGPLELTFKKDCLRIIDQKDPQPYDTDAPF